MKKKGLTDFRAEKVRSVDKQTAVVCLHSCLDSSTRIDDFNKYVLHKYGMLPQRGEDAGVQEKEEVKEKEEPPQPGK